MSAEALIDVARRLNLRIATAESCTGGMVSAALTDIPGSSAVFDRGFVTYSNSAKTDMLGVPAEVISTHGAASEEVARAMAEGTIARSVADLAVSVTGIAGPSGGTPEKPVGTVCFGWGQRGHEPSTRRLVLPGDRATVRESSIEVSLRGLIELLT